jgi:hypothetical protein
MAQSTDPITYLYEVKDGDGQSHEVALTRKHAGTAYARNGNAGNPTECFIWDYAIDGVSGGGGDSQRAIAYEYARAMILGIQYVNQPHLGPVRGYKNVRNFRAVAAEMKAAYRGQRR